MRIRNTLLVALAIFIAVGTTVALKRTYFAQQSQASPARPGTLDWYAERANGAGSIVMDKGMVVEYAEPPWDQVLNKYTFLVAEMVESKAYPNGSTNEPEDDIYTWYRFRIHEILRLKDYSKCSECIISLDKFPPDFGHPRDNEVILNKPGGTLLYRGVHITLNEPNFPQFSPSQKYLLIIHFNPNTKIGLLMLGPWGVYTIDPAGQLTCVVTHPELNRYKDVLSKRYGNSIDKLRLELQNRDLHGR